MNMYALKTKETHFLPLFTCMLRGVSGWQGEVLSSDKDSSIAVMLDLFLTGAHLLVAGLAFPVCCPSALALTSLMSLHFTSLSCLLTFCHLLTDDWIPRSGLKAGPGLGMVEDH